MGTEAEDGPGVEGAGGVEEEVPSTQTVVDFCLVFAEVLLQLVNRDARKEVKNIILLVSASSFDAGELHRHVKEIDEACKKLSDSARDKKLTKDVFTQENVKVKEGHQYQSSSVKNAPFGSFTETSGSEFVAKRVIQLARYFEKSIASS